jgi:hypothetical protein
MSAMGHKRTFAVQKVMSALPPKADIDRRFWNVRFVPKADKLCCGRIVRLVPIADIQGLRGNRHRQR